MKNPYTTSPHAPQSSTQSARYRVAEAAGRANAAAAQLQMLIGELHRLQTTVSMENARTEQLARENTELRSRVPAQSDPALEARAEQLSQELRTANDRLRAVTDACADLEATIDVLENKVEVQQRTISERDEEIKRLQLALLNGPRTRTTSPPRASSSTGLTKVRRPHHQSSSSWPAIRTGDLPES